MKRLSLLIIVIILLALGPALVARAGSSANYAIPSSLVASGGQTASSANYTIASTAGQPAIGRGASASYSLCSGFWCQVQAGLTQLFLPLVKR
jgi:hypothetical protein